MSCKKCTEDSDTDCGCFCGKPHASIGDSDVCAVEDWHGYSNSYGRGAGYAWEASMGTDFETAKQKQIKKCEDDADNWEDTWNNGSGECELCLSLTYPKCKSGFKPFGCNICISATIPDDYFTEGRGWFCTKPSSECVDWTTGRDEDVYWTEEDEPHYASISEFAAREGEDGALARYYTNNLNVKNWGYADTNETIQEQRKQENTLRMWENEITKRDWEVGFMEQGTRGNLGTYWEIGEQRTDVCGNRRPLNHFRYCPVMWDRQSKKVNETWLWDQSWHNVVLDEETGELRLSAAKQNVHADHGTRLFDSHYVDESTPEEPQQT